MSSSNDVKPFIFYTDKISYKSIIDKKGKKRYFVSGHVSSGDLDLVNDILTKNAMKDMSTQFKARNIKLDFDHETIRPDNGQDDEAAKFNLTRIVLGKAVDEKLDGKGNKVKFELNPTWKKFDSKGNVTMTFAELWSNIESGFYDAFSIGYVPVKTAFKSENGVQVRMLDKLNLINVALTGNPINPAASMTSVMAKSLDWLKNKEGKNMEDLEKQNEKFVGKSYEKDGAHAHTEAEPLGLHNHPEIESMVNNSLDWIHERIDMAFERINEKLSVAKDEVSVLGKGCPKKKKEEESKNKDQKKYNQKGDNMSEEDKNKNQVAGKGNEDGDQGNDQGGQEGDAKEGKSAELAMKSMVDAAVQEATKGFKSEIDAVKAENVKLNEILGKARNAGQGAANSADKAKEEEKVSFSGKSEPVGTLDYI